MQTLYVSGDQPDQFFAQIDASNGVGWYLTDHLGSVRDLMNDSDTVTDTITYDAYGNIVSQTNQSQEPLIGFAGYQIDAAVGLNYAHYRWYNPQTGQWLSEDPLLLQPGPNPREYVNDRPTNATDPTGEEPKGKYQDAFEVLHEIIGEDLFVLGYIDSDQYDEAIQALMDETRLGLSKDDAEEAIHAFELYVDSERAAADKASAVTQRQTAPQPDATKPGTGHDIFWDDVEAIADADPAAAKALKWFKEHAGRNYTEKVTFGYYGNLKPWYWIVPKNTGSYESGGNKVPTISLSTSWNDWENAIGFYEVLLNRDLVGFASDVRNDTAAAEGDPDKLITALNKSREEWLKTAAGLTAGAGRALLEGYGMSGGLVWLTLDNIQEGEYLNAALRVVPVVGGQTVKLAFKTKAGQVTMNWSAEQFSKLRMNLRAQGKPILKELAEGGVAAEGSSQALKALKEEYGISGQAVSQEVRAEAVQASKAAIGNTGCFIAGTPTWITLPRGAAVISADENRLSLADATLATLPTTIPIEEVDLGQRVSSLNPASDERLAIRHRPDYTGWKVIRMEVRHRNGSIVDVELLRPAEWMERNGLHVGVTIDLQLTEIEVNASGHVVSIGEGPAIPPGEGAVVTGRFVTRKGSGLVRVTFEDGTQLVGTAIHPVWSPLDWAWRGLGELEPGQFVHGRAGLVTVASTEKLAVREPLYNIEVDGEHVYEVTALGVLVHNNNPLCEELLKLRAAKAQGQLTAKQSARLAELEAKAAADPAAFAANKPVQGELFPDQVPSTSIVKVDFPTNGERSEKSVNSS